MEEKKAGLPRRRALRDDGDAERIVPGRNRTLQAVRTGKRKLFDKKRKEVFLSWFAATANLGFSASQAGVCRQTVSKHRLKNAAFEAEYLRALSLSVPDLEARLHAYMKGKPKLNVDGELELPDDKDFDPQLAIQILREQKRIMREASTRGPGKALKAGRAPRVATNKEVREALEKALKALQARNRAKRLADPPQHGEVAAGTADSGGSEPPLSNESPNPLHHAPHGPPPRDGEDL